MEWFLYDRDLRHEKVKAYKNRLVLNLHSKQIILLGLLYFKLFICPPDVKKQIFSGPLPPEPPLRLRHEPTAEFTTPPHSHLHFSIACYEIKHLKTQSLFKNGH